MSSGLVFVLHGAADEAAAGVVVGALAPFTAISVRLGDDGARSAQIGAGAACVLVWTRALNDQGVLGAVLKSLPAASSNTVICRSQDVLAPLELRARARAIVDLGADAGGFATELRGAVADIFSALRERAALNAIGQAHAAPSFSGARQIRGGKKPLALRSAYGFAATFAVVGLVGPAIAHRAMTTGIHTPESEAKTISGVAPHAAVDAVELDPPMSSVDLTFGARPDLHSERDLEMVRVLVAVDGTLAHARSSTESQISQLDAIGDAAGLTAFLSANEEIEDAVTYVSAPIGLPLDASDGAANDEAMSPYGAANETFSVIVMEAYELPALEDVGSLVSVPAEGLVDNGLVAKGAFVTAAAIGPFASLGE